jgi:ribonuclease/clavin/mitogillin
MAELPRRVVTSSMLDASLPDVDRWSSRVVVVLGQNPGMFTGPGTNTYIVGTGSQRILLDTGQGVATWVDLLEGALTEYCDGASLERIVITHGHPDHHGGIPDVLARWGEMPILKKPWPGHDLDFPLQVIDDGAIVRTEGATLRALWTPGHARDHLCFYLEEDKAVFTGDVVLGAGTTVVPPDGDLGDYLESLERLLTLDLEVIYPAHGPAIHNPYEKIQDYIDHRKLRDLQILDGIDAGVVHVEDLVKRIYTDIPEFVHAAAGVSVSAHLRRFLKNGVLRHDDGGWKRA